MGPDAAAPGAKAGSGVVMGEGNAVSIEGWEAVGALAGPEIKRLLALQPASRPVAATPILCRNRRREMVGDELALWW